jgi:hypothetical protein
VPLRSCTSLRSACVIMFATCAAPPTDKGCSAPLFSDMLGCARCAVHWSPRLLRAGVALLRQTSRRRSLPWPRACGSAAASAHRGAGPVFIIAVCSLVQLRPADSIVGRRPARRGTSKIGHESNALDLERLRIEGLPLLGAGCSRLPRLAPASTVALQSLASHGARWSPRASAGAPAPHGRWR